MKIRAIFVFMTVLMLLCAPARAGLIGLSGYASGTITGSGTFAGPTKTNDPKLTAEMLALAAQIDHTPTTKPWSNWDGYPGYYEWFTSAPAEFLYLEQPEWNIVNGIYVTASGNALKGTALLVVDGDDYLMGSLFTVTGMELNHIFLVFPEAHGKLKFTTTFFPTTIPNIIAPFATVELDGQAGGGSIWAANIVNNGSVGLAAPFSLPVPEPATLGLLTLGGAAILRRGRNG